MSEAEIINHILQLVEEGYSRQSISTSVADHYNITDVSRAPFKTKVVILYDKLKSDNRFKNEIFK